MKTLQTSLAVHEPKEIKDAIIKAGALPKVTDNKKVTYYNAPLAFDIESTSFEVHSNGQIKKQAIMYIWTLSINDVIVQGRTWQEFIDVCKFMSEWYELNEYKRLVIYVHNLAFEFQFFHKWFEWDEVFSLKKRQPIRALTNIGIEFRCSYKLSGYSLENLGKNLTKYKVQKLVGDLDYNKLRNSKTQLTDEELSYCVNDVLVVSAYIKEYIERVGNITRIPNTKTGEVRIFARNYCFYAGGRQKENKDVYHEYRNLIKKLVLTKDDYILLKLAFAGGFTHANALYSGDIIKNVHSMDFTSSYPYVMISEQFPMSAPQEVQIKSLREFLFYLSHYCCFFTLELYNVQATKLFENYLSSSHCTSLSKCLENNGRVVNAEYLKTTITEQDFFIIASFYKWDSMKISNFRYMKKAYLPTNLVKCILDLYNDKTTLKGIVGREVDYLLSKERINSMYGMAVTDICRDEIIYSPLEWTNQQPDIYEAISKNNNSKKRFLYYPWGVWVTAYARRNLFTAIAELEEDYIYSDTDSVKFVNYENHKKYFDNYNQNVIKKLKKAMAYHKIPFERTCPKNNKGEIKQIGVWDDEGIYTRFKTIGAKRYMVEKPHALGDYNISLTVSGVNKFTAIPYLLQTYGDRIFDEFKDGLFIPAEYTGKLTHSYLDDEQFGYITDYQGNTAEYYEKSSIHLAPAEYSMSLSRAYIDYLLGIHDEEV